MKPPNPLNGRLYTVEPIPLSMARELVGAYHYSGASSNTAIHRHGLFRAGDPLTCLGAALWLPPTPPAARSVADGRPVDGVLALSRLVLEPDLPTNAASFLLGRSIRLVHVDDRFHTLLTYADEAQGHTGTIYRATNWEYLGTVRGHVRWLDATGRHVAAKAGRTRSYSEMAALGYRRDPRRGRLHKFRKVIR